MTRTLLGIDWGQRRVGLAIGNTFARQASPLPSVAAEKAAERLGELITTESVTMLVMGLPRGLDGRETAQTVAVRDVAEELGSALQCQLVFQDETLSTDEALKLRKNYKDADLDSLAATVILQDYLDQL